MARVARFARWVMLMAFGCASGFVPGPQRVSAQRPAQEPAKKDAEALLMKIWTGIQAAQSQYTTGCGTIVETRTSKLLRVPLVFHGKFCASGMDKFFLEYFDPEPVRLVFNRDSLNVTTGTGGKTTEIIKIGAQVKRTQAYFSRENSIRNLKDNFSITARELPAGYEMKFAPRSQRFKQKFNYLVITLSKTDFLLRSLEIDGTSGVNSVFKLGIESLNTKLGEDMFKVYRQ